MQTDSIVILTGAGISAESGIRTFRDSGGLWEEHTIEDVATPEGFDRDPDLVLRFYDARRAQLQSPEIQPNLAHLALAKLEKEWPGKVLIVTQNVDDLHERAGSQNLIHMHGELLKVRCTRTEQVFSWAHALPRSTLCPCCKKAQTLRPHIVWFGEMPFEMERIAKALESCSIFASIGTSGNVYPAAGFVQWVGKKTRTIEINKEQSSIGNQFKEHWEGTATELVPRFVENLLSSL